MKSKFLLKGLIKHLPRFEDFYNYHKKTGGTDSARYCYSVWLRHLLYAHKNGLAKVPKNIVELGPGDSLGVGLASLISGVEHYYSFDKIKYTNTSINLKVFNELVELFINRTPIPDNSEFPNLKPKLENYQFPKKIFSDEYLQKALAEDRLESIKKSIEALDITNDTDSMITYESNWEDITCIKGGSIEMILSQAALEYVDDLKLVYKTMYEWLSPDGLISHQIDFKSHNLADNWYGHWTYSDLEWKIVKGKKKHVSINREPYSTHIRLLNANKFRIICDLKVMTNLEANRSKLAKRFVALTDDDITIESVFIQAKKSLILFLFSFIGIGKEIFSLIPIFSCTTSSGII